MNESSQDYGNYILVLGIIIGIGIGSIFAKPTKYQGLTAEEWFNKYDEIDAEYTDLKSCVEFHVNSNNFREIMSTYNDCF